MSINTEIQKLQSNLSNAYLKCSGKGAIIPTHQNFDNLGDCIKSFTTRRFGIEREVVNGVYQSPVTSFVFSTPSNATQLGENGIGYAFNQSTGLTSVDMSSLTAITGEYALRYAFQSCTNLTSIDLSSLVTINGNGVFYYGFQGCSSLTLLDLSSLTTVSGSDVFYYMLNSCDSLTTMRFSKLETIGSGTKLRNGFTCKSLTNMYFNALKTTSFGAADAFNNMFNSSTASISGAVTVHFPSNLTSTISGLTGYPNFGGTSGRIILSFDLPATS